MSPRVLFVAGASGAVGKTVVRLAGATSVVPHYRKPPEGGAPPGAAIFALDDRERLVASLRGATTVAQLIGTMRKRFAAGDTYESSDIGTTARLVEAAKEAGSIDHIILLSSVGAGRPTGAYLQAKAKAEAMVTASGIPFTILRPSAFLGEGRGAGLGLFAHLPLGKYRPVKVEELAKTIVRIAATRAPLDAVLEGGTLYAEMGAAAAA